MKNNLEKLFALQSTCVELNSFKNEFQTMRLLYDRMPEEEIKFVRNLSLLWLQNLEQNESIEFDLKDNNEKIQESRGLRQQGNQLFTAKGVKRNVLGACRFYNDAIYAALDTGTDELALGFANRAAALQAFGYYQQAYDDCVCALKSGYPVALHHKIILRQAYCNIKMQDFNAAEKHLSELKELDLNAGFSKELKDLQKTFDELKKEIGTNEEGNLNAVKEIPLNRETQEIITTKNGRCMQSKCPIEKNQLIFTERASAFVTVGDTRRMCHQCGTVNFIPIPCLHCRGRVNYCSLKCKEEHKVIHEYECPAYRIQFFANVGIAHLALRIILDNGLFSILNELKLDGESSSFDVWSKLTEGGFIWKNNSIAYAESLRMITHLNKMSLKEIEWFALMSHHVVAYLKHYTKYFDILNATNKNIDWELLTASLMLRHIGQSISNGHTLTTIIPSTLTPITTTDFHMLNENIWSNPWHLKLGYLSFFSSYDDVAALNLPYLSLCNHSCVQVFQPKFSGRFISTYALRDIKKDEEITNCYYMDYRKSKREKRRERLQETYYFKCECENCIQTDNKDKEFNKFNQYRCDNTNCGQIFVPNVPEIPTLQLLQTDFSNKINTDIFCTICGQKQTLKWYQEAKYLMTTASEAKTRQRLYQIFEESQKYLVGFNKARCFLAQNLIHEWFTLSWINVPLNDEDYCNLTDMIKYVLNVTRKMSSVNSVEYITEMIYMWELMAKRKYKCSKAEMDEMLWALSILSDDLKLIFLNYYNDYIKDFLNK